MLVAVDDRRGRPTLAGHRDRDDLLGEDPALARRDREPVGAQRQLILLLA